MSEQQAFGFGKFVPGFDFLQSIAKGASEAIPQLPNLSNWVAPTLNVEELEKRIEELKAVHFWLEQNSKALGATIQALEVQKMTLATLRGMNFNMGDVANALKLKAADSVLAGVQKAGEKAVDVAAGTARAVSGAAVGAAAGAARGAARAAGRRAAQAGAAGAVDPLQWWGGLTQQFQQIAANAMQDAAPAVAAAAARQVARGVAKGAPKNKTTAAGARRAAPPKAAPRKPRGGAGTA